MCEATYLNIQVLQHCSSTLSVECACGLAWLALGAFAKCEMQARATAPSSADTLRQVPSRALSGIPVAARPRERPVSGTYSRAWLSAGFCRRSALGESTGYLGERPPSWLRCLPLGRMIDLNESGARQPLTIDCTRSSSCQPHGLQADGRGSSHPGSLFASKTRGIVTCSAQFPRQELSSIMQILRVPVADKDGVFERPRRLASHCCMF